MRRYKDFPRGWNHIQIPTSTKAGALAGVAMYTPSSRRGELAQQAAWAAVSAGGPRLLPGRAREWALPGPPPWRESFLAELTGLVGPFDDLCAYERREGRHGLLLLLLDCGEPVAFVKAVENDSDGALDRELAALRLLEESSLASFVAPRVLGDGTAGEWRYAALEPLPPRIHRMVDSPPLDMILHEVRTALGDLERPAGTPAHWEPAHGDFTPWNLRDVRRGPRVLIDWEEAGWAPPGADAVLYIASAAAVGRPVAGREIEPGEAAGYWWGRINERIADRIAEGQDMVALDRGLLEALQPGADRGARS